MLGATLTDFVSQVRGYAKRRQALFFSRTFSRFHVSCKSNHALPKTWWHGSLPQGGFPAQAASQGTIRRILRSDGSPSEINTNNVQQQKSSGNAGARSRSEMGDGVLGPPVSPQMRMGKGAGILPRGNLIILIIQPCPLASALCSSRVPGTSLTAKTTLCPLPPMHVK
jgi:hypothetical protein